MSARRRPFDLISSVLAERLQGCEPSDDLEALLQPGAVDWKRVIGHASAQFILPALAAALRDLGLMGSLDGEVATFLKAVYAANAERNRQLCDELSAVVAVLNRARIEPVLLKGAIRLTDRLYPDHGWRMLRDLDLLVPKARWEDALGPLKQAGYLPIGEVNKEVSLWREGGLVAIDLHREIFSTRRQERLLRAEEVSDGSRRVAFESVVVRVPSMLHQVVHLIGHRQLANHNHAYGRMAWRDWFEAAALEHWGSEEIDWQAVFGCFEAAGFRGPLLSFLLSLQSCSLGPVPVPGRIGPLASLHQRRLRLQAESATLAHVTSWAVWCASELRKQIEERDESGQLRIVRNSKRLIFERGAAREMVGTFLDRAPRFR